MSQALLEGLRLVTVDEQVMQYDVPTLVADESV